MSQIKCTKFSLIFVNWKSWKSFVMEVSNHLTFNLCSKKFCLMLLISSELRSKKLMNIYLKFLKKIILFIMILMAKESFDHFLHMQTCQVSCILLSYKFWSKDVPPSCLNLLHQFQFLSQPCSKYSLLQKVTKKQKLLCGSTTENPCLVLKRL